jgi:hypothetical protein
MTKKCRKCNIEKALCDFYQRKDTGLIRNDCKLCVAIDRREYREKNQDKIKKKWSDWEEKQYEKDPQWRIKSWLKQDYNLTLVEYETQFRKQGGVCYICNLPDEPRLAVDHCHKNQKN